MNSKITSLHSTFSVNEEISNEDTRFLNITIDVMHTGLNLNGSYFEKKVVESCIDSIKNTAVLGFVKYDKLNGNIDFKGHEYILTKTENGIEEKYIGHAYGVIPESCNPRWITKMCSDGQEREFLQVDALLWEKFNDSTSILYRDTEKAQSMELEISSIEGNENEDGVYCFTKFKFDGCCILGNGVEPAMIDANVAVKEVQFALNDFVKSIQDELNDKYIAFTKIVDDKSEQGGIRDMSNAIYTQTLLEQFSDISTIVKEHESVEDRWGDSYPRYYAVDVQENEVIVVDRKSAYNYFGFTFTMDNDKPIVDFSSGKRKKLIYADYEEGTVVPEDAFNFGKHIEDMESVAFSKVEEANSKFESAEQAKSEAEANYTQVKADYDEVKANYEEMKPKYDEYVAAEEQRIANELNTQKDAKFAEYEDDLADNADFTALKERKDELSVEDIEKECAVLFAKAVRGKKNFSNTNHNQVTVDVIEDDVDAGYVSTKYGNIRTGR